MAAAFAVARVGNTIHDGGLANVVEQSTDSETVWMRLKSDSSSLLHVPWRYTSFWHSLLLASSSVSHLSVATMHLLLTSFLLNFHLYTHIHHHRGELGMRQKTRSHPTFSREQTESKKIVTDAKPRHVFPHRQAMCSADRSALVHARQHPRRQSASTFCTRKHLCWLNF
jgi:hypothetical protein